MTGRPSNAHVAATGVREEHAVLLQVLKENEHRSEATRRRLRAAEGEPLELSDSAEDRWLGVLAEWLLGSGRG